MDKVQIEQKIKEGLSETLGIDINEVVPEAHIGFASIENNSLGADSLDVVELTMLFEEEFDIEIPDEDAEKIVTVQDAFEYIADRVKGMNARKQGASKGPEYPMGSGYYGEY